MQLRMVYSQFTAALIYRLQGPAVVGTITATDDDGNMANTFDKNDHI